MRIARARGLGPDSFVVTYNDSSMVDSDVPHSYLERLADDGYGVVGIDYRGQRITVEPRCVDVHSRRNLTRPAGHSRTPVTATARTLDCEPRLRKPCR